MSGVTILVVLAIATVSIIVAVTITVATMGVDNSIGKMVISVPFDEDGDDISEYTELIKDGLREQIESQPHRFWTDAQNTVALFLTLYPNDFEDIYDDRLGCNWDVDTLSLILGKTRSSLSSKMSSFRSIIKGDVYGVSRINDKEIAIYNNNASLQYDIFRERAIYMLRNDM